MLAQSGDRQRSGKRRLREGKRGRQRTGIAREGFLDRRSKRCFWLLLSPQTKVARAGARNYPCAAAADSSEGRGWCVGRVAIIKSRLCRLAAAKVGVPVGHGYNYFLACDTAERIIFAVVAGSGSGKLCWHSRGNDNDQENAGCVRENGQRRTGVAREGFLDRRSKRCFWLLLSPQTKVARAGARNYPRRRQIMRLRRCGGESLSP